MKKLFALAFILAAACGGAQQVVVAVFPFEARSGTSADDANTVTEVFNIKLQATGALRTVGRNVIDNIIKQEHIYQMSDFASDEKTAQLRKGLNAEWVVYGVVTRLGSTFVITATLIDLNTNETMGGVPIQMNSIEEAFEKMDAPITDMVQRLTRGGGTFPARPSAAAATEIAIEVTAKTGGTLYFQDKEIATLWDNDTHTIPIERPGTYTVKMVFVTGMEKSQSVVINSRGVTKISLDDSYAIGETG
ncbi:MAG: hypothetical protein LBF63_10485, partial [Treponema sp.]|nr:hypothetical protein [Treponema sp.]